MTARSEQIKTLLNEALELEPGDRAAFVDQASARDAGLAQELRDLLAAHERAGAFLGEPTVNMEVGAAIARSTTQQSPPPNATPEGAEGVIGRYKLRELLGEGGFGSVYMAEQREPVTRKVALKIIKLGMDTRQVIARFEAERQALAMMDHPGIAAVFDAGTTSTGRPYFVMELVKGVPITEYCDRDRLGIEQRLHLFAQVCAAVQHAHAKGIIHRDIKPSNVLVTINDGQPLPKVIDFGIAKATTSRLTDKTLFTEFRALIGTPEYMSPEQADIAAADIDTRADVYSLGVLLYELVAGTTPFDGERLRSASFSELQQIIQGETPLRPSTRLTRLQAADAAAIAAKRAVEPRRLKAQLRSELDWIVMKCLEKDRSRRYQTPSAIAEDIDRFLSHQPVAAGPPTAAYRIRKFVRRNRAAVVAASLVSAALVAGAIGTTWFGIRAMHAETEASRRADQLAKVVDFQQAQLSGIDPNVMGEALREDLVAELRASLGRKKLEDGEILEQESALKAILADANMTNVALKALDRNIFQRTLDAIAQDFDDQPQVKADLLAAAGATLVKLGIFESALNALNESLALRRQWVGSDHEDTLHVLRDIGSLLHAMGRSREAEPLLREAVDRSRQVRGADHAETVKVAGLLGAALEGQGKAAEAEPYFRESLTYHRRVRGTEHRDTIMATCNFGYFLFQMGKFEEGEALAREAVETCQRVLPESDELRHKAINILASMLWGQNRLEEAESLFREAIRLARIAYGDDHLSTLIYSYNMGSLLRKKGALAESEAVYRDVAERSARVLGLTHWRTPMVRRAMAQVLNEQGRAAEAESWARDAVAGYVQIMGPDHKDTFLARSALGVSLRDQGRFSEAREHLLAAADWAGAQATLTPQIFDACVKPLIQLYESWEAAEPGRGHAQQAAIWLSRQPPRAPGG